MHGTSDRPPESEPAVSVAAALERLTRLHPKRIDLSLGRMHRLLAALGNPEQRLPPVVHVAGTNGKGSTVAFLNAMLEAAGQRVHVYTSPHLVRFNERIVLAGRTISDAHLADALDRCEGANGDGPITFFEVTTAAALLAFSEVAADFLLLEVGLGGRLDATNVVDRPACTAITRISYDHMQFLGDTIGMIAAEKAGILKRGVPAVVARQPEPDAGAVIQAAAQRAGAALTMQGRDWVIDGEDGHGAVVFPASGRRLALPEPALPGRHQVENAACAAVCLETLLGTGESTAASVRTGVRSVQWPARLQRLSRGPLTEILPGGELWLDGGHNDSAGEVLAAWLGGLTPRPLGLVVGMLETKDPTAFLEPLAPLADRIVAIAVPGTEASLAPEHLAERALAAGFTDAAVGRSLAEAVANAAGGAKAARVLVCGSLYLAGAVLQENA